MRKLLALAFVAALYAQDINYPSTSASGSITAANAACTATSCVWIVTLQDNSAVSVQLTGTFTATVQFETSVDGTTWVSTGSATATGISNFSLTAQRFLRVRASAFSSGPVVVAIAASKGGGSGAAAIACAATPGNTSGTYRQQCQTAAGAVYACNNAAGCALAADWVAIGGGGGTYPGAGVPNSTGSAWGTSYTVGTAANNLVQMTAATKLPAVDGSSLTNLSTPVVPLPTPSTAFTISLPNGFGKCTGTCTVTVPAPTSAGEDRKSVV